MNDLPEGIRTIRVTENRLNLPQVTTETDVASLKRHLEGESLGHETELVQKRVEPIVPETTEQGWYIDRSRFDFHIDPVLNQSVGGPENFYMYQLGVMATADLWLTDHLLTTGSLFGNIANNYDKFNYTNPPKDSTLPRVRTRVREYVQNDAYVNNLQATTSSTSATASTARCTAAIWKPCTAARGRKCFIALSTAIGRSGLTPTTSSSATGAALRT